MTLRALIVVAAFAVAGSAAAQPPAPSPEVQAARAAMQAACANDIKTVCGDAQGRAVNQCLRTNQSKLSPDCAAALAKMPAPPAGGGGGRGN